MRTKGGVTKVQLYEQHPLLMVSEHALAPDLIASASVFSLLVWCACGCAGPMMVGVAWWQSLGVW